MRTDHLIRYLFPDWPPSTGDNTRPRSPAPRPRLWGWSILITAASNLALIGTIAAVGVSMLSLVALAMLELSCWLLVVAEVLYLKRLHATASGSPGSTSGISR